MREGIAKACAVGLSSAASSLTAPTTELKYAIGLVVSVDLAHAHAAFLERQLVQRVALLNCVVICDFGV